MTLWLPWLLKLRVCPAAGAEKAWRATEAGGRTVASDKELSRYVSLLSHQCDQDQYKVIRLHVTETNDVIICVAWVLWASAVCVCVWDPGTASHCVAIIELSKLLMFHKYNASEWISWCFLVIFLVSTTLVTWMLNCVFSIWAPAAVNMWICQPWPWTFRNCTGESSVLAQIRHSSLFHKAEICTAGSSEDMWWCKSPACWLFFVCVKSALF